MAYPNDISVLVYGITGPQWVKLFLEVGQAEHLYNLFWPSYHESWWHSGTKDVSIKDIIDTQTKL